MPEPVNATPAAGGDTPAPAETPKTPAAETPKVKSFGALEEKRTVDDLMGLNKKEPVESSSLEEDESDDSDEGEEEEEGSEKKASKEAEEDEEESLDEEDDEEEDLEEDDDEEAEEDEDSDDEDEEGSDSEEELHEVKVNGKVKKYTLQQLKNMVSSGVHTLERQKEAQNQIAAKEEEIQKRHKQFEDWDKKLTPITTKLKKGDLEGAFYELAETQNLNTLEVRRKVRDALFPQFIERLGLDPEKVRARLAERSEAIKVLDTAEENDFLKRQANKPRATTEGKSDPESEAQAVIADAMLEHGITKKEFDANVEWLKQNTYKGKDAEITLEAVVNQTLLARTVDKACQAIDAVRPKLLQDQSFVDRVVKKVRNHPDWSVSQAARWVAKKARQMSSNKTAATAANLAKDISRKALKGGKKSSFESPNTQVEKKPKSFRDLDNGLL